MHRPYLLVISALSVLGTTSANFLDNKPLPTATFTPGKPTILPEPKHALETGQRYANPHNNPFHKHNTFVYAPPETVKPVPHNSTLPGSFDDDDQCQPKITAFEQRWAAYHHEVFYPGNKTAQLVGFSPEILETLEKPDPSISGEVTRSQPISYDCKKDYLEGGKDKEDGGGHENHTSAHDGHAERDVFPPDTRVEIFDTWAFPRNVIGQVGGQCTGTLIGPRHVLTAGHCVHSGGSGGDWFADLDFVLVRRPGVNGTAFTKQTFKASHAFSVRGWTRSKNTDWDYGLVVLQENTNQGWMSFGWHTGLGSSWRINIDGFPGDKSPIPNTLPDAMWHSFGRITDDNNEIFEHDLDTFGGMSGSPSYLFLASTNFFRTYGVHSGSHRRLRVSFPDIWNTRIVRVNRATRINKARFNQICGWMGAPEVC